MLNSDLNETYRLSDALWKQIEPLLPPVVPNPRGGRPRMDDRKAMEAILYALHTDFKWKRLPSSLGAPSTVRKRFQEWREAGVFERMWRNGFLAYDELRALFWHGRQQSQN